MILSVTEHHMPLTKKQRRRVERAMRRLARKNEKKAKKQGFRGFVDMNDHREKVL